MAGPSGHVPPTPVLSGRPGVARRPWYVWVAAVLAGLLAVTGGGVGAGLLLTRTAGLSAARDTRTMPAAFVGTWTGMSGGDITGVVMTVRITDGRVGDVVGSTTYEGYCTQRLTLSAVGPQVVVHEEEPADGSDCYASDIRMSFDHSDKLTLEYSVREAAPVTLVRQD
ncbi:hypothetical protein I6A84_02090 [Frankia sp. CNm7]|nr:hypothetical protein [Frankia nepalensis]MBL7516949.1 hypothetical protein [Frankia nepalensis]